MKLFKTTHFRNLSMIILFAGLTFTSCKDSSVSPIIEDNEMEIVSKKASALMSNTQISNNIIIDDFNGPTGSWKQWFPSLYTYQVDETVLGGARELRSYRDAITRIDGDAGTLEWGGNGVSSEYSLRYGSAIGANFHSTKGANPNGGMGTELNLDLTLDSEIVLQVSHVSATNPDIVIILHSSSGSYYWDIVTLMQGEEVAADIDGIILDGFSHNDAGSVGTGTVFEQISIRGSNSQTNVYISDNSTDTYDPIFPATADPNWTSTVCYQGNSFGINATWSNPHKAFQVTQDPSPNGAPHPWESSTFDAYWINAVNDMDSPDTKDINGNAGPEGHNWTRYETQVAGNGEFVVQLIADNCSWIYLADENGNSPQLIGYQGAVSTPGEYGVTLDGNHTLTFIIYDGGGLAGGKFRLETTESFGGDAPDPIATNNAPVADAGEDQTVTATGQTTPVTLQGSGTDLDGDELTFSWSNGATGATPTINLPDGIHTLTLTVSDGEASDTDEVTITVVNTVPVADAGPNQTIEATGSTTSVTLTGSGTDADGDELSYSWSNGATSSSTTVTLSVGVHTFTLTVADGQGASDTDEVVITITDTTAPELSFNQETANLWPPNHKMVLVVTGISATDIVDGATTVSVTVSSNESDNGNGDGNTESDYEVVTKPDGTLDVYVRSERSGKGDGRTYTITMNTSDTAGNNSSESIQVHVAQNKGGK